MITLVLRGTTQQVRVEGGTKELERQSQLHQQGNTQSHVSSQLDTSYFNSDTEAVVRLIRPSVTVSKYKQNFSVITYVIKKVIHTGLYICVQPKVMHILGDKYIHKFSASSYTPYSSFVTSVAFLTEVAAIKASAVYQAQHLVSSSCYCKSKWDIFPWSKIGLQEFKQI